MRAFVRYVLIVLLAATVQVAPTAASDKATGLARLVGVWQLDSRVSDDPKRMMRRALPPGGSSDEPSPLERRLEPYLDGVSVMTISWDDPRLVLRFWDERERVLVVDGKKRAVEGPHGERNVEVDWGSSDRLVIKITGDPVGKIVEQLELGGRGEKLFHTVDLYRRGTKRRFTFQRLYNRLDPVEETSAPSDE